MTDAVSRLIAALADRYRIERKLGQGGMATVYLAEDLKHHRKVALKVLKPELAAVLGAERFVQEITTTAALQHPHILPLFDSGTAGGFLYYVMPFIDGETLRSKLDRETQLGIDESVKIAVAVADALDYAHRHGVIHRDIKPENILLHDGRPMVADFGIALAVSAAAGGRMTETGLSLGTPHYMSPEQATAEKEITARSDVYSLGSVLYEMLTGSPPHVGASAQQIIMKIVTEEAVPVTKLRKAVPPNVAAAVATSLEKLPADRFPSAAVFAAALENPQFTAATGRSTYRSAVPPFRRFALPVLVAAAFLFAGLAAWGWLRPRPASNLDPVILEFVPPLDSGLMTRSRLADFALSPDGKTLAYSSMVNGIKKILLRRMDTGIVTGLAGAERGSSPYFSPDGRWLAFHVGFGIFKVPVTGGPPVQISDTAFAGGGWSEDGWIYHTFGIDYSLRRRPASGGPLTLVAPAQDGEFRGPWHAIALPGGSGVIFRHCSTARSESCRLGIWREGKGVTELEIRALAGWYLPTGHLFYVRPDGAGMAVPFDLQSLAVRGDPVPVLENISLTPDDAPNLAWSPSGTLAYVRGNQIESGTIARMSEGGQPVPISTTSGFFRNPVISPSGEMIALHVFPPGLGRIPQLWVADRRSGTMRPLITDRLVTAAAWSPDGHELAVLASYRGLDQERWELYRVRADGRDTLRKIAARDTLDSSVLDWTPDGRWLVTTSASEGRERMVAIAANGTGETKPLALSARSGAVSPDGQWLAYLSNESGSDQVYVRSLWESGAPVAVSAGAVPSAPQWRGDGRALYFITADTLRMVELGFNPVPEVTGRRALPGLTAAMNGFCECYAPSPQGNDFVVVQRTVPTARLTVVLNWFSDVRRRLAQAGP